MQNKFRQFSGTILLTLSVGLFPLIALWKINLGQIPASVIIQPLLFTLVFIVVNYAIWLFVSRTPEKAALLSAIFSIFVFSFGHVYNLIGQETIFGISIGFIKLLTLYLILLIVAVILILRLKHINNSIILSANIAVGILVIFNLVLIGSFYLQIGLEKNDPIKTNPVPSETSTKPNIYYIVLDSYSREDIMKNVMEYDNSIFIKALQDRGFFIPECAFSNYDGTLLTIASVLNYQYLDTFGIPVENSAPYLAKNINLILDSRIAQTFREYGYQFVTGRGYSSFNDILSSDIYLNFQKNRGFNDDLAQQRFNGLYANTTIIRILTELFKNNPELYSWIPYWLPGDKVNNITLKEAMFWFNQDNYIIDSMEGLAIKPGSYFVYAHINALHGPYTYRADGTFRYPPDTNDVKILNADTLTYLDKRLLELVDILQNKSTVPPIIILQGDHGIHGMTFGLDKHKILSAYYLPGDISTQPYDTITPVNDFRLILRDYFDPSMQLLPDTLWVKFTNDYEVVPASCDVQP